MAEIDGADGTSILNDKDISEGGVWVEQSDTACGGSIPSNIAEGQARRTMADFLNFLSIAQGYRAEVETQILIAQRLG